MKKLSLILALLLSVAVMCSCGKRYSYRTVEGDPLKTRIYTLDNGLKVYMAVNKETPRIQTYIAVKVGGKNDPAQTTGLAHYFEHLMFKGTQQFGTQDYEAEKPLLDTIEQLFERYRTLDDEEQRKALYRRIDSVSQEASKLAIPNEYDKLMAAIGANGTNAYTGYDQTVYVEDIPSNQIDNWARIQADRFKNVVIRGFHTELETIYEEKNMSLTSDTGKEFDSILNMLYPHHPYGTQDILGTQEHLKNPSITNVKKYHDTYYVPNNMAICLSGDFDPEEMIATLDKYFGDMVPNPEIPVLSYEPETPIAAPEAREVLGPEAENVAVAWRIGGAASEDADLAELARGILYNGQAGLFDINLNLSQSVLGAYAMPETLADYGVFYAIGYPKQGQSLDEVRELMLGQIARLRAGDFDEELLQATINNLKSRKMARLDTNAGRADAFVNSFINGTDWSDEVKHLDRLGKITKEQVVAFANRTLGADNYVMVYKRQGTDPNEQKIAKPEITPIATNRDAKSDFLAEVQASQVKPIEPVFVDYDRDLSKFSAKSNLPVLYKRNETTGLFTLTYLFETGSDSDPVLSYAFDYLNYLGTGNRSAADIAAEFYKIACSYAFRVGAVETSVVISGLNENMEKAMALVEELIAEARPDEQVLANMKADYLKSRQDNKLNQNANFNALRRYAYYGPDYIRRSTLSNEALGALTSEELLGKVRDLFGKEHTVLYYGPSSGQQVVAALDAGHRIPETLAPVDKTAYPVKLQTPDNRVLLAQYDAKQLYYQQFSDRGEQFDPANDAELALYNEYFGGGMNSIVFQEMREARGLAYSASAHLGAPQFAGDTYYFIAIIATQNDKMTTAIEAFDDIINRMPESEAAFNVAKESLIARLRTARTIKSAVLNSYLAAKRLGIDYDRNKALYEKVRDMTLEDVKAAQRKWVEGRKYTYCILGDIKELDLHKLQSLSDKPVEILSSEQIFGY